MLSTLTVPFFVAVSPLLPQADWIDLIDSVPPGTPPTVEVVDALSNGDRTVVEVLIPGLWAESGIAADGNPYVRYALPETNSAGAFTGTTDQVGAPELPTLEIVVALPPGTSEAHIDYGDFDGPNVMYIDVTEEAGAGVEPLPLPRHTPGWDGDPDSGIPHGIAPGFKFDASVYGAKTSYPKERVAVGELFVLAGGLSAVPVELRPFFYDPGQNRIGYQAHFRVAFAHPGLAGAVKTVSRDATSPTDAFSVNSGQIKATYSKTTPAEGRTARLLMVAPTAYAGELLPLIQQRRLTGFDVELRRLETLPDTEPATVRSTLGEFLAAAPDGYDSYALLVGDVDQIPLHPPLDPNGQPGDGPYSRPLAVADERLHVGRLTVDDADDLVRQVQKVVRFEREQAGANEQIGLAAHGEQATGIAGDAHYAVWQHDFGAVLEAAGFVVEQASGTQATATPKLLEKSVDGKFLTYHGFGSAFAWPDWTLESDSLMPADVLELDNEFTPIHFAFAPRTAAVDEDDCLAEAWLAAENGAVAVVGAVTSTPTTLGYKLSRCFVKSWTVSGDASSPLGLHYSSVLDVNDAPLADDDRWILVGDPGLTVPLGDDALTSDVFVDGKIIHEDDYDDAVVIGPTGGSLNFRVEDSTDGPSEGVLVVVVISSSEIGPNGELLPPMFQRDVYTDANGKAEIDFIDVAVGDGSTTTKLTASLNLVFGDGSVRFISDSIDVQYGDTSNLGGGVAGSLGQAPCLWSVDLLEAGETLDLGLTDAPADETGALFLAIDSAPVPLGIGVLHAWPIAATWPFETDAAGEATFSLGPLPAQLPSGVELVLQAVVVDTGATAGFAMSNGLKAAN